VLPVVVKARVIAATNHMDTAIVATVTAVVVDAAHADQNHVVHAHALQRHQLQSRLHVLVQASQSVSLQRPVSNAVRSEPAARDVRLLRL